MQHLQRTHRLVQATLRIQMEYQFPREITRQLLGPSARALQYALAKGKSSAVQSRETIMKLSTYGIVVDYQEEIISILTAQPTPVNTSVDELCMPHRLNFYKSGLRLSARIRKLNQQGKYLKRKRAHVTYRAATTRALLGLYTLF